MRWLLIALVLILQVQAPAVAQLAPLATPACHDMAMADEPAANHGDRHGSGSDSQPDHRGAGHLCPGCSIPGSAASLAPARDPAIGPVSARALVERDSLSGPPSLPPPRQA
jgi:hypothetical protein